MKFVKRNINRALYTVNKWAKHSTYYKPKSVGNRFGGEIQLYHLKDEVLSLLLQLGWARVKAHHMTTQPDYYSEDPKAVDHRYYQLVTMGSYSYHRPTWKHQAPEAKWIDLGNWRSHSRLERPHMELDRAIEFLKMFLQIPRSQS